MSTDSVADLLTRLRNAQRASHQLTYIPKSKMGESILNLLKAEGYLEAYEAETYKDEKTGNEFERFKVHLGYRDNSVSNSAPSIEHIQRVSKPGRRVYQRSRDLKPVLSGLGIAIISTSQGVMTDREARRKGVGGEVLANVY